MSHLFLYAPGMVLTQCFTNLRFLGLKFRREEQERKAKARYKIYFNHKLA